MNPAKKMSRSNRSRLLVMGWSIMNDFVLSTEILVMLLPLLALQLGLAIYCIVKIYSEGVQNLNKLAWSLICIFINLIGPITFMIVGRKREYR